MKKRYFIIIPATILLAALCTQSKAQTLASDSPAATSTTERRSNADKPAESSHNYKATLASENQASCISSVSQVPIPAPTSTPSTQPVKKPLVESSPSSIDEPKK